MQDRINELAVEAGLIDHENAFGQLIIAHGPYNDELQRFAQAVARECLNACDAERAELADQAAKNDGRPSDMAFGGIISAERIHKAIRARFGLGE